MPYPFVYVRAGGSYLEIGRQVGEAARAQIQASIAFFRDNFEALSGGLAWGEALGQAAAYLRYAERYTPRCVEELRGMAEGSGVPFDDLLVPNCGEEFTSGQPIVGEHRLLAPGCTAVAVASGGRHIVGHNMDWYVIDAPNNVLFDLTAPDGTRLLAFAGACYLPMVGVNSHGVGNVSNSVSSTDNHLGVPNCFVRRSTMEDATLEAAREHGLCEARARGTNQFFADTGGRLWDVESSATASAFMDHTGRGFMAHTNHYVSPDMAPYEGSQWDETRVRLATAERLLAEGVARGDDPIELVKRVLRCHEPRPDEAICGHPNAAQPVAEQGMTVGSIVCDLDERQIRVLAGPPCEAEYQLFSMD
jgi:isopenicillin-N N-acyltransferase-like protein